jgi:DNA (cytosine-5)-methyltransferase 1
MIELFAGVGGFRLAAEKHGIQTILWNQWEPSTKTVQHAHDVYRFRFKDSGYDERFSNKNISTVSDEICKAPEYANPTFLVGGFPCQDYSVAKSATSALGLEGKKGVLWWDILKLAQELNPRYLVLENVDRLLKSPTANRGRDFAIMLASLGKIGYQVEWRVITASDFGSFQKRRRIFIVASKTLTKKKHSQSSQTAARYLQADGLLAKAFPVSRLLAPVSNFEVGTDPLAVEDDYIAIKGKSRFLDSGLFVGGQVFTASTLPRVERLRVLREVLVDRKSDLVEIPEEYFIPNTQYSAWEGHKFGGKRERTTKDGFTYNYTEGSMAFPDDLDRPSRTILTGEGGPTPSRFKHAVATPSGRIRRLLPEELEQLNGFPPGWTETGINGKQSANRRAFFMGNALVVGVVERIFASITEGEGRDAN